MTDTNNGNEIGESFYHYSEDSKKWGKYMLVSPEFEDVPALVRWDRTHNTSEGEE